MTSSRSVALQWSAVAAVAAGLLYLLGPILAPFVAAAILAYICNPLVGRLCAWKVPLFARNVPRALAVVLVMSGLLLLLTALLLIVLPLLEKEIGLLMVRLPAWLDALGNRLFPWLQQWLGVGLVWDSQAMKYAILSRWQDQGDVAALLLTSLGESGGALIEQIIALLLVPFAMFYLLRDWNALLENAERLVPRHWHTKTREIAIEVDRALGEFLYGQISVMLLVSVYYVLLLWLVGLEFALPIGIVAGLLVFVPYLGIFLGLLLGTLAAAMQFSTFGDVAMVWLVFGTGHLLEAMVITPWLVGDRIGLHPLAVIFALFAFGHLFGFFGVLLALPMAAILLVVLRHGRNRYLTSDMYGKP
ncbi:MAG: AI-2E family transporter [Sideroxyarcus sp.]|nr:AI-2E family transporter [Sideroxyarcus sp.]